MSNVKTYVKKPIPIFALQYTGDNREEILEFTNGQAIFKDVAGMKELVIHTLEGDMIAVPGSYIACGSKASFILFVVTFLKKHMRRQYEQKVFR